MLGHQSLVPAMLAFRGLPAMGIGTITLYTCNCRWDADLSAPLIVAQGILERLFVDGGGDRGIMMNPYWLAKIELRAWQYMQRQSKR